MDELLQKNEKGLSIFCKVDYTGYADRQQRGKLSDSVLQGKDEDPPGRKDTRERV